MRIWLEGEHCCIRRKCYLDRGIPRNLLGAVSDSGWAAVEAEIQVVDVDSGYGIEALTNSPEQTEAMRATTR